MLSTDVLVRRVTSPGAANELQTIRIQINCAHGQDVRIFKIK
jgi:hypothetical protein